MSPEKSHRSRPSDEVGQRGTVTFVTATMLDPMGVEAVAFWSRSEYERMARGVTSRALAAIIGP